MKQPTCHVLLGLLSCVTLSKKGPRLLDDSKVLEIVLAAFLGLGYPIQLLNLH